MPSRHVPPGNQSVATFGRGMGGGDLRQPPIPGTGPGGLPLHSATYNVFPPYLYPTGDAVRFSQRQVGVTAVAGATTPIPFNPSIVWGQGQQCALEYFEVSINDSVQSMDIFFTILNNQGPLLGLEQIRTLAVDANGVSYDDTPYYILGQSGELTMTVTNNSPIAFEVSGLLKGWTFSSVSLEQLASTSVYLQR